MKARLLHKDPPSVSINISLNSAKRKGIQKTALIEKGQTTKTDECRNHLRNIPNQS